MELRKPSGAIAQPDYEVIKKEDLQGAFEDAIERALLELLTEIRHLIDLYSATAPSSLWVWDYTARWDYDMWW